MQVRVLKFILNFLANFQCYLSALVIVLIISAVKTMEAVRRLQIVGYETIRDQKIMNPESKTAFVEFLDFIKSLNFKLGTYFFDIDWTLLYTVSCDFNY